MFFLIRKVHLCFDSSLQYKYVSGVALPAQLRFEKEVWGSSHCAWVCGGPSQASSIQSSSSHCSPPRVIPELSIPLLPSQSHFRVLHPIVSPKVSSELYIPFPSPRAIPELSIPFLSPKVIPELSSPFPSPRVSSEFSIPFPSPRVRHPKYWNDRTFQMVVLNNSFWRSQMSNDALYLLSRKNNRVSFLWSFASVFTTIFSEKNMQKVVYPTEDQTKNIKHCRLSLRSESKFLPWNTMNLHYCHLATL